MKFDFDELIPRAGTSSVKWEFISRGDRNEYWNETSPELGDEQVLPMWIADMDFKCPQVVINAIQERAAHGIFGYSARPASYDEALVDWLQSRQNWQINPDWIVTTPGVVPALHFAVRQLVGPGEKVLVQGPVYYPFYLCVTNNDREYVSNSLVSDGDRYVMDVDDLERKLADPGVKLAILCNPHNPVGRVWTRSELQVFADLCLKHDVMIVSDEIHADLCFPGQEFTPLASLGSEVAEQTIVCTAASKAFNIAGLHTSNIIIKNDKLRREFYGVVRKHGLFGMSPFGIVATEAAYREGGPWLDAVIDYIVANHDFARAQIARRMPMLKSNPLEATYLLWIDCRDLGLNNKALSDLMMDDARVYLDDGYIFGPEGNGFERINIACPRSLLARALDRIEHSISKL